MAVLFGTYSGWPGSNMSADKVSVVQVASVLSCSGARIFDAEARGDYLSDRAVTGSVVEKEVLHGSQDLNQLDQRGRLGHRQCGVAGSGPQGRHQRKHLCSLLDI